MRCSGWSSRVIWASSASAIAFVLTQPASAAPPVRLSINPPSVEAGQNVEVALSVPNASDRYGIDHVTLGIPGDFRLWDAEAKSGWTQSRAAQAVTWGGGKIPVGQFATFAIRGTAPQNPETVLFNVLVGDRKGKSVTYRVGLVVAAHGPEDRDAKTLGKTALVVGVVAGLLALGAFILGLYLWLRRPPLG
jgi:uncharacterized protein YcnI